MTPGYTLCYSQPVGLRAAAPLSTSSSRLLPPNSGTARSSVQPAAQLRSAIMSVNSFCGGTAWYCRVNRGNKAHRAAITPANVLTPLFRVVHSVSTA